jgi:carbon storage regulator
MLVLARKKGEAIMINEDIEITVIDIQGDQVKIGIEAPRSVSIHRKEVFLEIKEENRKAAEVGDISFADLAEKMKGSGKTEKE